MKKFSKTFGSFLAGLLAAAMVVTSVPEVVFAASLDQNPEAVVEDVDAVESTTDTYGDLVVDDEAPAPAEEHDAEGSVEEEPSTADIVEQEGVAVKRVFTISAQGGNTSSNNGNIGGTYGTSLASQTNGNATYTITNTIGEVSTYTYKFMKLTGTYTETDFNNADGMAAKEAMLEETSLPSGLSHSASGLKITVSGTPLEVVADGLLFLVVKDTSPTSAEYDTADDVISRITVDIVSYGGVQNAISPARDFETTANNGVLEDNDTIKFGAGTKNNVTSVSAKQGYTVGETAPEGSEADNVVPVVITYSAATLSEETGGIVNAEIISFDEGNNNSTTSVTSGTASSGAFTVTPAASAKKLSDGEPAKFTVAPAAGLLAKSVTGTTYRAKLVVTSTVFTKKTYDLEFTVSNGLAISSVTAHGGAAASGNGSDTTTNAYDLGSFKVGETIDDVVIVAAGGKGTLTFTADTASTGLTTLPEGLRFDTSTAGQIKISGMANPIATSSLDTTRAFGVTVKDEETGVETSKLYFKYRIAQADVGVKVTDGAYVESKAASLTLGAAAQNFSWYGVSGAAVTNEYATININNKSGVDLTFKMNFATADQYTLDPETVDSNKVGLLVKAGSEGSFKVLPKTSANQSSNYTLSAIGMKDTTGTLTYAQNADLTITKPATSGEYDGSGEAKAIPIDAASIGKVYSYTFEETHPATVKTVTWKINTVKVGGTGSTVAVLNDDYGLSFNNGTLSGTVKGSTATSIVLEVQANDVSKWVSIAVNKPAASVKLSSNGDDIANDGKMSMGSVKLDSVTDANATIAVKNDVAMKQTGIKAEVTAASLAPLTGADSNDYKTSFKIEYDPDTAKDTALGNSGLTLGVGESGEFKIKALDTVTKAGTYELTVKVVSDQMAAGGITFTSNLKVTDVPTIKNTNNNKSDGGGTKQLAYTVGTAADGTEQYYYAEYATNTYTGTFTYALMSGEIPGLTFNEKGYFEGTPTTAGTYKVTVSATTDTLQNDVTGTLTHEIVVTGNSTLSVKLDGVATILDGKTYTLPGEVVGYEAKGNKLALVAGATAEDATGVTVSVADAEDDRNATENLDGNAVDVIEHPENPYKGSNEYLGVSTIASTITEDEGTKFYITTKAGAPAGFYKVTVTVSATNASPVKFDVAMVVVDKLEISVPASANITVADTFTADDSSIYFTAEGGYADQKITWSEKGTSVDSISKYYITKSATAQTTKSDITNLLLATEADKIGAADGIGLKNEVVTGTAVVAAGTYTVNVGASVAKMDYSELAKEFGHVKDYIDRVAAGNQLGTSNIIPAQTAKDASFSLTIKKSSNPQITDLTYATKTASSGEIAGTVKGQSIGKNYLNISEYTYPGVPTGYSAQALTIKMTDVKNNGLYAEPKHTNSDQFTIAGGKQSVTSSGTTWTLTPATGMPKGTYTDVITFGGDDIEPVRLTVNFIVEDKTYLATVDNNITKAAAEADASLERVEYIANSAGGTTGPVEGSIPVELNVPVATTGSDFTLAIRNSGNSDISDVTAREVTLNSTTGNFVGGGNLLTFKAGETAGTGKVQLTVAANVASVDKIPVGQYGTFKVTNAITTATDKTAYIDISFKDAEAAEHEIIIPVKVLVLNGSVENVSVTPGSTEGEEVSMTKMAEFYSANDAALMFTVKNENTAASEKLIGVGASLSGTDAAKFAIVPIDSGNDDVGPGKSMDITVKPVEGLAKGTYTATIQFTADNMAAQSRVIEFEVEESTTYTANRVTTAGMFGDRGSGTLTSEYTVLTTIEASAAERLYNSLASGLTTANDYVSETATKSGDTKHVLFLDLDKDSVEDLTLTFTGGATTEASGKLTGGITAATIAIHENNSVTAASKTITLTAVQQSAAKSGGVGNKKCFSEITFNLYSIVDYAGTLFEEKTVDLEAFDGCVTVGASSTDAGTVGQAKTSIRTLVPYGSVIGSVFKDGKLPTAIETGKVVKGWETAEGSAVTTSTVATGDISAKVNGHKITYSTGSTKVEDDGVKWVWTTNNGNYDAVLYLTDTSGDYDNESLITIEKDTAAVGTSDALDINQAVVITDNGSQPANCTKGSRKELKAEAKMYDQDKNLRTYSSTYSLSEADDALGHTWLDPVVTWTDSNGDGKYTQNEVTVTRTCSACGEKITLSVVSVTGTISVEPTCTRDGKATYSVTYANVDKYEKAAGNVTDTKNVKESTVKALGHNYDLVVEWAADHKTVTKATLVCDQCTESETGHTVDVTTSGSITYNTQTDKETGEVLSNQAIYAAGTENEVKSEVWLSHTEHNWVFDGFTWSGLTSATGGFTCSVGSEKKSATVEMTSKTNGEGDEAVTAYTATVSVDPEGKSITAITETKYVKADGTEGTKADFNKAAGSSESGSTEGEAVQTGQETVNLFYTDVELSIPLPSDADVSKATGNWKAYYEVDSSGDVTVLAVGAANRKKAANAKNSLIVIPRVDSEGNVIGEFEYSLPVSYVKPTLKLTSTKGTVKTGAGDQVLFTRVTEKKSTGAFEPLDISDQDTENVPYFTAKSGSVTVETGDNAGDLAITASAKASGKIGIQLPNWTEKIELAYTVAQSAKNVLTASTKQITVNVNADKNKAEAQSFKIYVNGNEASSEDAVAVTLPKKDSGLVVTGIENGQLTDSEVTFAYGDAAPVKGTYTYKFSTADKGSVSVKVVVSNAALANKSVTYKVQGKMDVVTRTPMVLIPTLKGVTGEITDVTLGDSETEFEAEYNEETNQVIVTPVDWTKVAIANTTKTFTTTVSGVECKTDVKFKPLAKKPTVKIDKVVLPKAKVIASTEDDAALGTANVYAYSKFGGKTFSVAPDKVTVDAASAAKANVKVEYDEEEGVLNVTALPGNSKAKLGSVKVTLQFGSVSVTKSVSIKAKK